MHIPDGFLSDPICAATTLASGAAVAIGAARLRTSSASPAAMGAVGAGVFAAQMVNFPIDHGTSGHVLGAAAAAILLGPWTAMLLMTMVLGLQCFLFADGGVASLGANVLNMGVVAVIAASGSFAAVTRYVPGRRGVLVGSAVAGWVSVVAAAAVCSIELACSGAYGLGALAADMLSTHAAIGVGEALVTAGVVALVGSTSQREVPSPAWSARGVKLWAASLAVALVIASIVAPLASSAPDGLMRVASDLGFADLATGGWSMAAAPDYILPGLAWQPLAVALAGVLGVTAAFAGSYAVCKVSRRLRP